MDMIIGFWKPQNKYGEFSNWYSASFDFEGRHFVTSEQAFMYKKAELFKDNAIMEKIMVSRSPYIAKNLGRSVKPFDPAVFDKHKYGFMRDVVYAKFSQNDELKSLLLSTGDAVLAEASPKDSIWGIGMSVDDPDFGDPSKWKGQNLLGKALMEVREMLKNN